MFYIEGYRAYVLYTDVRRKPSNKTMDQSLHNRLEEILDNWTTELTKVQERPDIIALNFGIQKVWDGFEVYLSGHTWYDNIDDLWMLDDDWTPEKNYVSLGEESLKLERLVLLDEFKKIVDEKVKKSKTAFNQFHAIVVGLSDSDPIEIKWDEKRPSA
jgi:hypothetical protein